MTERRAMLDKAKEHLAAATEEGIRHAALELRFLMETIVYAKLRQEVDYLPEEVIRLWQPPQLIKALLEFDPLADESFELSVADDTISEAATEDELRLAKWSLLGSHHALKHAWLRKNYNKIGSLLHATSGIGSPAMSISEQTAYLEDVSRELERATSANIIAGTFRDAIKFNCRRCGTLIVRNVSALKAGAIAVCSSKDCASYSYVRNPDGTYNVELVTVKIPCRNCGAVFVLAEKRLKPGTAFRCESCGRKHGVAGLRWIYTDDIPQDD